jgi:hypothetical protein
LTTKSLSEEGTAAAVFPPLFFNMVSQRTQVSDDNGRCDGAAQSTVEALMFSLRRGSDALADSNTLHRLAGVDERQLLAVMVRLQKFKPEIAAAWTPEQIAVLAAVRRKL